MRARVLKGFLLGWPLGSAGEGNGGEPFHPTSQSHLDKITELFTALFSQMRHF